MTTYESLNELNNITKAESFVCLYSGGKDSGLAISIAKERAQLMGIINCVENGDYSRFHSHNKHLIELQGQRIGTTVEFLDGHWKDEEKLNKLLIKYKNMGATTVVFGDIRDDKNAKKKIRYCQACGMRPCMPLWQLPSDVLISLVEQYSIKTLITTIRSPFISENYLGTEFDREAYNTFLSLGIDPFGENGEFHTTLVDASCFDRPIFYCNARLVTENDKFGKKINCYFDYS